MSIRLFTGIFVPEVLHERLTLLQGGVPDARWVKGENFHITLSFIGDVDEGSTEDIHSALSGIKAPGFDVTLDGVGKFGSKVARLLWAALEPCPGLTHVHDKVHAALVQGGFPLEARSYKPHVTLAYLNGRTKADQTRVETWLGSNAPFLAPAFHVEGFSLIRSDMGHGGSHYSVLEQYKLDRPQPSTRT